MFYRHILIIASFLLLSVQAFSQTEAEMKTKADAFFENANFLEATPLYLRLLSLKPRDFDYNYRFGTCLLFNSDNKKEAIKHLNYAASNPSAVPETFYYLGKALHLNYQFSEAIKQYQKFISVRSKPSKLMDAEREIEMCQNGQRLLTTLTDIIVQDKKEIAIDKFFRVYDLNDLGGNFLVTADFQTKEDKKNGHTPLVYFPEEASVIYYSSYGDNGNRGKEIYYRQKNTDGTWGDAQLAEGDVNSTFDEDFPYMHPDGQYLYFSSKGHNSMGGFDVFRCKLNPSTGKFGPAENLDFAISSPDDDLLYVVDANNENAWFASARQSQDGTLQVYKVRVERVPIQLVAIKGDFNSELDPTLKKVKIEVRDVISGQSIGVFNSNEKSIYQITFPKGGKYEYTVTLGLNESMYKSVVSIPYMKEFKPLKQRIIHKKGDDGSEQIVILNLFDEEVDDPQAIIAEVIMKRSELNINADQFDLDAISESQKNREVLNELGIGNLLPNEVADLFNRELQKTNENLRLKDAIENNVRTLVIENAQEFTRLEEEIKVKVSTANTTSDKREKYILLREADELIKAQKELNAYSASLLKLNDSIDGVFSSSDAVKSIGIFEETLKQFNVLIEAGDEKGAFEVIGRNKDAIQNVLTDESLELVPNLVAKAVVLDEENRVQQKKIDAYADEIRTIEISLQSLQNSVFMAKKKDLPGIQVEIASKQEEIRLINEERNLLLKQVDIVTKEKDRLNKQISIIQDAISNKSVIVVSKDQARNALLTTQKVNSNTLTSYVEQQISILEAEDPSLRESINLSSGRTSQTIYAEYISSVKAVQEDTKLSPEEKLYKILSIERKIETSFTNRLEEIEKVLFDDPTNTGLDDEKRTLATYQKDLQKSMDAHERQVELLLANQKGGNSKETLTNEIEPEYDEEIAAIENNESMSAIEKENARQAADQKLSESIAREKAELATKLRADPDNTLLKGRNEKLTALQMETKERIDTRENELAQFDPARQNERKIDMSKSIHPEYLDQRTQLAQNSDLTSPEKLSAFQNLDESFLAKVDQAIADNAKLLAQDPNNKINQQKDIDLNSLRDDYTNKIAERKVAIALIGTEETRTKLRSQVDPGNANQLKTVESNTQLSEQEKITQLKVIEEQYLTKLNAEKVNNTLTINANPLDEKALLKDAVLLNEIKQQEERIKELENLFIASSENPVDVAAQKRELEVGIDGSYENERAKITSNKALSPAEKLNAIQNLDESFLAKVNLAIADNAKLLAQDPNNKINQQKDIDLNSLRDDYTNKIAERKVAIALIGTEETRTKLRSQVDPGNANQLKTVESNTQLSEQEKITQLKAIEEQYLRKLNAEKVSNSLTVNANPLDEKSLIKDAVLLNEIKQQEERIKELEKLFITSSENPLDVAAQKRELEVSVDGSYENERAKITSNKALSPAEKLNAIQNLDKGFVEKVNAAIVENDRLRSQDPSNTSYQQKAENLSSLKSEKSNEIAVRSEKIESLKSQTIAVETIENIDPEYTNRKAEIDNNSQLSAEQKAKELATIEQARLSKLTAEQERIKNALSQNPTDESLLARQAIVETQTAVQEKVIEALNERQQTKVEPATRASVLATINPEYERVRAGIVTNSGSEKEKLESLIALDKAMLEQVSTTKTAVASSLKNGNDEELKNKMDVLTALEREIQTSITTNETQLTKLSSEVATTTPLKTSLAQIDPSFEKDVETIQSNTSLSEVEKSKRLQVRDQQLLSRVNKEIETLEELGKGSPDEAIVAETIENLKTEKDFIEARMNERTQLLAATTPEGVVNPQKVRTQTELLTAVLPGFDAQLNEITSSSKSELDKLTEEIELRKLLSAKLVKERQALEKQVAKDATNVTAAEEIRVLDAAISAQKQSIAEKESDVAAVKSGVPSLGSPIASTEKQSEIKKIAPEYKDDLAIRQNKTEEQIDAALANEMDLNQRIIAQLEKVLGELNGTSNNKSLQRENEVLMSLLDENNQRISSLQNEKTELQNSSITQEDKNRIIDALDPAYRVNQEALNNDINELTNTELDNSIFVERKLLAQVYERIEALEGENGKEEQREKAILEALLEDVQEDIVKRQDVVKERNAAMFSAEEKAFAIDVLSPDYTTTASSISASSLPQKEKDVMLIDNEKEVLRRIYPAIEVQEKILRDNPDNVQAKRQLALLEQVLFELKDRLTALDPDGVQAAISAQAMTDQLMSDYTSRREFIVNDSKMNDLTKEKALLNVEQELLELVEEEIFRLQDVMGMENVSDENYEKFETLDALRSSLNSSIAEHKETINRPINDAVLDEQRERLLVDVMPDYSSRISEARQLKNGVMTDEAYSTQQSIEQELISKLKSEKNQVEKQLKKAPGDQELIQKQSIIDALLVEHAGEIARIESEKSKAITKSNLGYIESIKSKSLGDQKDILVESYSTLEEVKSQDKLLQSYEQALNTQLTEVLVQLKKQPEDKLLLGQEDALKTELALVKEKRRQVSVTIGELETEQIVENELENEDPELVRLTNEKEKVERALQAQNLTAPEEKKLTKELQSIEAQQLEREISLTTAENATNLSALNTMHKDLKQQNVTSPEAQKMIQLALESSKNEMNRADQFKLESDNSKDPAAQKYYLDQTTTAIENAQAIVQQAYIQSIEKQIEQQSGAQLDAEENLTAEMMSETNRINQLKDQYRETALEMTSANRKEKEELLAEQKRINKEIALLNESVALKTNERQELREATNLTSVINEVAIDQEITQEFERQLASSKEYADYYAKVNEALEVEQQIVTLDAQLTEKKSAVRRKVQVYAGDLTTERIEELNRDASEIAAEEKELDALRTRQEILLTAAQNEINLTEDMRLKMQNLALRGIAPIDKLAVIASLVSLPANGLTISAPNTTVVPTERKIPVNVKIPSGLVYRVQIGAFANPIPTDLFSEFNPVSGEKLNNGVTRYLAGYFNNSKRVVEARDQIKALGYADAFAVAYCDGKRITLAEARILEANGTCVALGENELNLELSANTAVSLGIDTSAQLANIMERDLSLSAISDGDTTKKQAVQNYTYNKAPGAAAADAIEKVKGLFFTVQIGVYNKPVSADVLYNLSPLMTLRLPNGQIRYSVGMFSTVEEARVKKQAALDRGAADAFVTAYFDGARITVAEAMKMLEERGNFSNSSLLTTIPYPTSTTPVKDKTSTVKPKKPYDGIQIVTKKTFNEYPVDVLNRYNAQGSFYFDETDKRVKSVIYPNEDALPQVSYFKEDIDTMRILRSELNVGVSVAVDITTASFDGEFTDWLLRQNYRRELVQTEEKQVLRLCNIPEDRINVISEYLTRIGINYSVLK